MRRPSVLVFAGADPSGGAGIAADILAIAALGAHALPVITALTVQDNDRVFEVLPVDADVVLRQARALAGKIAIGAVKIGIPGNRANADTIAAVICSLRRDNPDLPVVLDPVLASGAGDHLSSIDALAPLLPLASVLVPNLPEARVLGALAHDAVNLLVTGGHADGAMVVNRWQGEGGERAWRWPRLAGEFHGSGCTLAAAIAARLACGDAMESALTAAQAYCHRALESAYSIAAGQRIPQRCLSTSSQGSP
ncbi:bifunctional hydroxymethylpyrimidine kinase/phosphomethylpyrimidine kinase [Massilia sp. R2A-15]|uniref:bifunctional hydroxymethylpyrimidine kinase/phosphomethylpyrimidine kinase n=1 Tax=Massilia sp. R2A-15 TaxID=3064278 RepID=UPI002734814B|nr:bifunctional hydroxymethylpyrimidine kinase/phosphomethylpyrimidine kinase [Massilia sp. R2A-15]WLI87804.1 bifunctional hydroxymethylpyrimidine kinase/phosphomethylpyrimidine kinase [Massilia sp. R2A-15]